MRKGGGRGVGVLGVSELGTCEVAGRRGGEVSARGWVASGGSERGLTDARPAPSIRHQLVHRSLTMV